MNNAYTKLDSLTTLRFFAAAMIVLIHARNFFKCLQGVGENVALDLGVSFFFVLSGFILTYVYQRLDSPKAIAKFLVARFARIWPCHIAALLLFALVAERQAWVPAAIEEVNFDLATILAAQIFLVHDWFPYYKIMGSFNSPSWTISAELFFYLCFPVLLAIASYRSIRVVGVTLVPLVLLLLVYAYYGHVVLNGQVFSNHLLLYTSPLARLFEFGLGVVFGSLFLKNRDRFPTESPAKNGAGSGFLGRATMMELTTLLFVCFIIGGTMDYCSALRSSRCLGEFTMGVSQWLEHGGILAIPCAMMIMVFAYQRGFVSRILSAPALVVLGEISFAMYMFHGALLLLFQNLHWRHEGGMVAYMIALPVVSYLCWILVEKPARKVMVSTGGTLIDRFFDARKDVLEPGLANQYANSEAEVNLNSDREANSNENPNSNVNPNSNSVAEIANAVKR